MELSYHLFTGALAAVFAGLFNTIVSPVFSGLRAHERPLWRRQSLSTQFAALTLYLLIGIGLGFLFWLSWGLTAIVGVPWWLRGGAFALILWLVCCAPLLLLQLLSLHLHWKTAVAFAIDWLVILIFVGGACAWMWERTP